MVWKLIGGSLAGLFLWAPWCSPRPRDAAERAAALQLLLCLPAASLGFPQLLPPAPRVALGPAPLPLLQGFGVGPAWQPAPCPALGASPLLPAVPGAGWAGPGECHQWLPAG